MVVMDGATAAILQLSESSMRAKINMLKMVKKKKTQSVFPMA